ncbi:MAG: hypothetical protein J5I59_04080 [Saprospiraceae bacterium]|nr:hypothetical protein [Saprospiraceae bacterium]
MKNIVKYLLSVLLIGFFSGCSKPDSEKSLLEPVFKRCHLSKVSFNSQPWIEVVYKDDEDYLIDKVLYYQNGVVRDDWTETYTYEGGKVATRADQYSAITYSYNEHGDISKIINCSGNSCCTSTYEYDYDINNLPAKISTICDNGQSSVEIFDYTNIDNRSYFYVYQDKNGTSVSSYQKFVQNYINPLSEIYPNGIDYYQDRIIEDFKEQKFKEYLIESADLKGRYPTRITEDIRSMPSFNPLENNKYTFEYVGCD